MGVLQDLLVYGSDTVWFSNYAERPGKLFVGAEVLLTIILAKRGPCQEPQMFSTGFQKWSSEDRAWLFPKLYYSPIDRKLKPYVIPKLSSTLENSILHKLELEPKRLGSSTLSQSSHALYYRIGGGRYWKIFTNFQPCFVLNGKQSVSSRENYLHFASEKHRDAAVAILSSSLFYWYFILTTNCRDLNIVDLNEFPLALDRVNPAVLEQLATRCSELMAEYRTKSQLKEKTSSLTGDIQYEEFYPRLSKPIIDQIDRVLARHYGFTDEELDFIINYDIKYRMGKDADVE